MIRVLPLCRDVRSLLGEAHCCNIMDPIPPYNNVNELLSIDYLIGIMYYAIRNGTHVPLKDWWPSAAKIWVPDWTIEGTLCVWFFSWGTLLIVN